MERRHTDGFERTLEANVDMIHQIGFDGVSAHYHDRAYAKRLTSLLKPNGLTAEGQCLPKTVDDLNPVLEIATEFGIDHLDIQPNIRPRQLQDCIPLLEGWRRLAEQVDFPVLIETHRDRMTTDLHFTLDLLDCFPNLRLVGDLPRRVAVTGQRRSVGPSRVGAKAARKFCSMNTTSALHN